MRGCSTTRSSPRHADLFAGTGAFTMALAGISSPALYCECDADAVAHLYAAMDSEELPRAPIVSDVRDLHALGAHGPVDIVTAGFPCVGFSAAGSRKGLGDERSALVRSAVAAARRLNAEHVVLENSPEVVARPDDLRSMCDLLVRAGYARVRWTVVSAADVGAPHLRRRWFCLASVPGARAIDVPDLQDLQDLPDRPRWDATCPPPMCQLGMSLEDATAIRLLGNSLVPQAARAAIAHLVACNSADGARSLDRPAADGAFVSGRFVAAAKFVPPVPQKDALVVLDPTWYVDPGLSRRSTTRVLSPAITATVLRKRWPTPRHGPPSHSHVLTERTSWDLCTAARFCSSVCGRPTQRPCREARLSRAFVEYLMRGVCQSPGSMSPAPSGSSASGSSAATAPKTQPSPKLQAAPNLQPEPNEHEAPKSLASANLQPSPKAQPSSNDEADILTQ